MAKVSAPFLLHIRDSIDLIASYIGDMTFDQFREDKKTQDAVIRQLEIIGEAATKLADNVKMDYADIPWREITDFRNVLAHQYWDIDLEIVWKAATKEIKELKQALLVVIEKVNLENKA